MNSGVVRAMGEADTVFVIDDDALLRQALTLFLETEGFGVKAYASAQAFLDAYDPDWQGCIILDIGMPGMDGLALQQVLLARGAQLPIVFLTGRGDVPKAVQAVKQGAVDFLEKPAAVEDVLERVRAAMAHQPSHSFEDRSTLEVQNRYQRLTERQREVMALVTSGLSNKEVARELGISVRTAEGHRFRVMERMQAASLLELTEMARVCRVPERPGSSFDRQHPF
jgi:two-component system response regulator FixJ